MEEFISDVKQTGCQLKHNDVAILNLSKVRMPVRIYGAFYFFNDLNVAIVIFKDMCQKT